jgi:hypothetical protein
MYSGYQNVFWLYFFSDNEIAALASVLRLLDFIETPDQDYCVNGIADKKAYGKTQGIISEKESIEHDDGDEKHDFKRIENQEQIDKTCIISSDDTKFCIKQY